MIASLFGLIFVGGVLVRLIVLHPLPLGAALLAGSAALHSDASLGATLFSAVAAGMVTFIALGISAGAAFPTIRWLTIGARATASAVVVVQLGFAAYAVMG